MVFNNLFYRIIFSMILIIFYFISLMNNFLILALATIIYLIIFIEIFVFFKNYFYLSFSYITLSLFCFYIYFFNFFNFYEFNILILIIVIFDSFSFFSGKLYGKTYIFKTISPKKTFEGYTGGLVFTNIIILTVLSLLNYKLNLNFILFFINSLIFISIFGDLVQSYFKRKNHIKNSSTFLPGHGGFFDRFDSFLPSIIFLLIYSYLSHGY